MKLVLQLFPQGDEGHRAPDGLPRPREKPGTNERSLDANDIVEPRPHAAEVIGEVSDLEPVVCGRKYLV